MQRWQHARRPQCEQSKPKTKICSKLNTVELTLMARMRASQSYDGVYEQPMATPMIVAAEKSFIFSFQILICKYHLSSLPLYRTKVMIRRHLRS